jgi:hypothetical protein
MLPPRWLGLTPLIWCAFYALFAIFPALSALISLYGLTASPESIEQASSPRQADIRKFEGRAL